MKDALGHGSDSNGSIGAGIKDRRATFGSYTGPNRRGAGEYPARGDSSNAAAAEALMSGLKSTMVPIHDSMAGRMSDPTSAPTHFGHIDDNSYAARSKGELSAGQKVNRQMIMNMRYGR